uniref:Subtilisin n=1 Tax=Alexandrium andersonii TaxID=327968 RepID=A0A7S2AV74_9DINO|mmetsp:Transcript_1877/g.4122  ORF Transcript_1877/g.4122 Transcript_1877/m.4122 type:complete len:175 (+) Transcript_1877:73-597(+)
MAMLSGCSTGLFAVVAVLTLAGVEGAPGNLTGLAAAHAGNSSHAAPLLRGAAVAGVQTAAGYCSAADAAAMTKLGAGHAAGSFPEVVATCGKRSWSLFGGFHTDQFLSCVRAGTGISAPCSSCFGTFGQYAYRNCKFTCLFGSWCGRRCLDCVKPSRGAVDQCTAVTVPLPTEC